MSNSISGGALPISSAYCKSSCTNCCCESPQDGTTALKTCKGCGLACYCSRQCQIEDWKKDHKVECKVMGIFKQGYDALPGPAQNRQLKAEAFLKMLPMMPAFTPEMPVTPAQIEGLCKARFTKFVTYSRVCAVCNCNEFDSYGGVTDTNGCLDWQCCPECNFSWCCSPDHWETYKSQHTAEICNCYQRTVKNEYFHYQHMKRTNESFMHIAEKPMKTSFTSFPTNWDGYFRAREKGFYPDMLPSLPAEYYPAATRQLGQPVTCLYAMYEYGIAHFTKLKDLTIHVVGAGVYEVPATCIWEEITHCLPNVKTLTVEFIGPEACDAITGHPKEFPTKPVWSVCPDCTVRGRQRLIGMYAYTYHDYVDKYLSTSTKKRKHKSPDLIIAFNTGMHAEETESWTTSLRTILEMNVPAYFTSYDESEAIQDYELLSNLEANILQDGPQRNPFSEDVMTIEAANYHQKNPDNFFANSMYGVLFQGRKK